MIGKKTPNKLEEAIKNILEEVRNTRTNIVKEFWSARHDILRELMNMRGSVQRDLDDALTQNELLVQALCEKYSQGTYIMYDEHNPRQLTVIKDGKHVDISDATSVSFFWDKDEFPRISIDRG